MLLHKDNNRAILEVKQSVWKGFLHENHGPQPSRPTFKMFFLTHIWLIRVVSGCLRKFGHELKSYEKLRAIISRPLFFSSTIFHFHAYSDFFQHWGQLDSEDSRAKTAFHTTGWFSISETNHHKYIDEPLIYCTAHAHSCSATLLWHLHVLDWSSQNSSMFQRLKSPRLLTYNIVINTKRSKFL